MARNKVGSYLPSPINNEKALKCKPSARALTGYIGFLSLEQRWTLIHIPLVTSFVHGAPNGLNAVEVSQCYKDTKNNVAILLKRLHFERYGVKTGEKANTHNQHWLTLTRFSPFSAQATISMIQVQRCSKLTHDDRSRS